MKKTKIKQEIVIPADIRKLGNILALSCFQSLEVDTYDSDKYWHMVVRVFYVDDEKCKKYQFMRVTAGDKLVQYADGTWGVNYKDYEEKSNNNSRPSVFLS
jgi:hypothetical protein